MSAQYTEGEIIRFQPPPWVNPTKEIQVGKVRSVHLDDDGDAFYHVDAPGDCVVLEREILDSVPPPGPMRMRRFRWYSLGAVGAEGVLFSNGCVSHTIDDWKGTHYYHDWNEFVHQYRPDRIEWIDSVQGTRGTT